MWPATSVVRTRAGSSKPLDANANGVCLPWLASSSGVTAQLAPASNTQTSATPPSTRRPALAASAGRLVEGGVADVCVFDAGASWAVTAYQLASQGKHTPFAFGRTGFELPARVRFTLVAGHVAYSTE